MSRKVVHANLKICDAKQRWHAWRPLALLTAAIMAGKDAQHANAKAGKPAEDS